MLKINTKRISSAFVIILVVAIVVQLGSVLAENGLPWGSSEETTVESDTVNTTISEDTINKLIETNASQAESQESLFQSMLVSLNVHEKFKEEIERLVVEGYALSDLLIAYDFLYQNFGTIDELEDLVEKKESGRTWESVFTEYNKEHEAFEPRSFDPAYLEQLSKIPTITPDDIMLADRISFVSDTSVEKIMTEKLESQKSWKQIAAELDVVHSASTLPKVQISEEQMAKFVSDTFKEEQVAEAFVLAQKLGETPETVVVQMKAGKSEEAIMAQGYTEKYN